MYFVCELYFYICIYYFHNIVSVYVDFESLEFLICLDSGREAAVANLVSICGKLMYCMLT